MRKGVLFHTPIGVLIAVVVACSGQTERHQFDDKPKANVGDDGGFEASTGFTPGPVPCPGLECKIVDCKDAPKTTIRGKVYDPAGSNPLYNVMVYIPGGNEPDKLPPIKDSTVEPGGVVCETCASVIVNPLRSALTDSKGEFLLEDVPVDKDVPIVIQVGKWRRLLHVDVTKPCEETTVSDRTLKLPKNSEEGNLPQIAVTTGGADALECILRGIGIDDKEFVMGHDTGGHVHLFKGSGGKMGPPAEEFWNDAEQLRKYDMVLLSCEGTETLSNKGGGDPGARASLFEYLNAGGKAFATHYHYVWFRDSPLPEVTQLADWGTGTTASPYNVNMTFPKGEKFAEWLEGIGASSTLGQISLTSVTNKVVAIREPALSWIEAPNTTSAKYFSVNTPIGAPTENQCGRAVYSDLHIDKAGPPTIGACGLSAGGLNAQQKAIEFLLFDLSACVTDDKVDPTPPQ